MSAEQRVPDHAIEMAFVDRWSPRSFVPQDIPDTVLYTAFEAARWAPSGSNRQPWRLLYAKRASSEWDIFASLPNAGNRVWAAHASALVLFVSQTYFVKDDIKVASPSHAFDTGAAWANFAHQAHLLGWHTHAMGGFDQAAARSLLNIPEDFDLHALVAIGKIGAPEQLPEHLLKREFPSNRKPLDAIVAEGGFGPQLL